MGHLSAGSLFVLFYIDFSDLIRFPKLAHILGLDWKSYKKIFQNMVKEISYLGTVILVAIIRLNQILG